MQSVMTNLDDVIAVLRSSGRLGGDERLQPLTGGVSALVAVVEGGQLPWIVKTPLTQLTVSDEWLVGRERGANEATILELLAGALGPVRTPRLLFFDGAAVVLGEEYIAPPSLNYKDELLSGRAHPGVARALGEALGHLHRLSVPTALRGEGPRTLFDALRLDPYYRTTAHRRADLREDLETLIAATIDATERTLVHGDLSPKNVLVTPEAPVLLDWEVIHEGDPGFDRGKMGAHFMLKALYHGVHDAAHEMVEAAREFWRAYEGPAEVAHSLRHAGGVMVARLYGKSPVDYLTDEGARERAQRIGAIALRGRVTTYEDFLALIEEE